MNKRTATSLYRISAVLLAVALLNTSWAPILSAQTRTLEDQLAQRDCEAAGNIWHSDTSTCEEPPDVCANVSGNQATEPCEDTTCEADGGTWNGTSCDMPPPPDACPNVSGDQAAGPCADATCATDGGTWNGNSCDMPEPESTGGATNTEQTGAGGGESSDTSSDEETQPVVITDEGDPDAISNSESDSAQIDPDESDTDNTDFQNIGEAPPPDPNDTRPVIDASATTTEAAALEPELVIATDTDGTGAKSGGTVLTGDARSNARSHNVLNITRSTIDGPGVTNSSKITALAENVADLTTDVGSDAFTGDNTGLGGDGGDATIVTGKAVSTAEVLNIVNTNLFNSEGLVLLLNPYEGDGFDLRDFDLSYFFDGGPGASPTDQYGCTILTCLNSSDLSVLNKNEAVVHNTVDVQARTGTNIATSTLSGNAIIETGDAFAAANVLNMVNTNFVNSTYLVLAMNNFGDLNDDIILPGTSFFDQLLASGSSLPEMNSSSYVVNNDNDEDFFGTTTATAITGENIATTTLSIEGDTEGHGEILTGNAYTSSNSFTAANQTRVGGASVYLTFRVYGEWSGSIKGLPEGMNWRSTRSSDNTSWFIEVFSTGSSSGGSIGQYNSSDFLASSTNKAIVHTDVNARAVTGQNLVETEDGVGRIATGDAYATANVINMVNTNIINRNWVFASFNVFGDWSGDIAFGGHSPDLKVEATMSAPTPTVNGSDITYTFMVTNHGDVPATAATLNMAYDKRLLEYRSGTTGSTETTSGRRWNLGELAVGASTTRTATMRVLVRDVPSDISVEIPVTATASVTSPQRDQNDADNAKTLNVQVVATPSGGTASTNPSCGTSTDPRLGCGSDPRVSPPPPPPSGGGGGGGGGGNTSTNPSPTPAPPTPPGAPPAPPPPPPSPPAPPVVSNPIITKESTSGGSSGGGGGGSSGVDSKVGPPDVKVSKVATVGTTTLPALVSYKIVVKNERYADGPLYNAVLTDTLRDPMGAIVAKRSWPLDAVVAGDLITVTYDVSYAATSTPGTFTNEAVVTGYSGNTSRLREVRPIKQSVAVHLLPGAGVVLGAATCAPLLTQPLGAGQANNPEDVRKLQTFLAADPALYPQGIISGVYGPLTAAAVKRFQEKYAAEILHPLGLSQGTGFAGASTIAKINTLHCGSAQVTAAASFMQTSAAAVTTPTPAPTPTPVAPKPAAKPQPKTTPASTAPKNKLLDAASSLFKFW